MNFFEHQDRAKRMTWRLLGMLAVAMVVLVVAVYVVAVGVEAAWHGRSGGGGVRWVQPHLFAWVALGMCALVGVAAWSRTRALDAGGGTVALALGGRQLLPARAQDEERVLLNVVEEMAIAAGLPVPFVFVLEGEPGINAFAAATTSADAAIAVTRGALTHLSRDELQGVIGHEFSHLLHGDSQLNLRLVGLLHGLIALSQAGVLLMRIGSGARPVGITRRRGAWPFFLVGLALFFVGGLGQLAARIIKAAVSRQREFLADAAAVQFSRNPDGLAGALRKIEALAEHGSLRADAAGEFSHLFFANALAEGWLAGFFATHPPLSERIRRLRPGWLAQRPRGGTGPGRTSADPRQRAAPAPVSALPAGFMDDLGGRFALAPESIVARVGAPTAADGQWSSVALAALPPELREATEEPFDALALLFALLLQDEAPVWATQEAILLRLAPHGMAARSQGLRPALAKLDGRLRLPLVELLMPALRRLSGAQGEAVLKCVDALAAADDQHSVFEYALRRMLMRRLLGHLEDTASRSAQLVAVQPLAASSAIVLSALAWAGHERPQAVGVAFRAAAARLPPAVRSRCQLREKEACTFGALDAALDRIGAAVPHARAAFIDACAHCVAADGAVTVEEAELLRTVAEAVGCPIPPLVPGLDVLWPQGGEARP